MSLFAISDLHLSLNTDKKMDVFRGWENYVERIEQQWKKIVGDGDTVVIPGDISWELKLENTIADFGFLESLPGKKVLLKGNHDLWWSTRNKIDNFFAENGFNSLSVVYNDAVNAGRYAVCGSRGWFYDSTEPEEKVVMREVGRIERSVGAARSMGLEPVFFLHYPPVYAGSVCRPIFDKIKSLGIQTVYYGHIHGSGSGQIINEFEGVKLKLVSADYLGFTPFLISKT